MGRLSRAPDNVGAASTSDFKERRVSRVSGGPVSDPVGPLFFSIGAVSVACKSLFRYLFEASAVVSMINR